MIDIVTPSTSAELAQLRELFVEYAARLKVDLCFQNFQAELDSLPGRYAPPSGALYLAINDRAPIGCVGMRGMDDGFCEMKRLYVRSQGRGTGLGRRLATLSIDAGRADGYRGMRLDTLFRMVEANKLYDALGFRDIPAYYSNPHEGVRYLELRF